MRALILFALLALVLGAGEARARKECRPVTPSAAGDAQAAGDDAATTGTATLGAAVAEDEPELDCTVSRDRNECVVLTNQIAHFEGIKDLARDRDDELWEAATEDHLDRLRARRKRFCPEDPSVLANVAKGLANVALNAARLAATAFTMGAF